jgi:osmotically-inducible protein OsmY
MVESHLTRVNGIQNGQVSLTSSSSGTTAVLTGTVASEGERRVAQQLLLLEPGINRVENLLEIR